MVMSTAHAPIPARPMRCSVLRPARSTTKSCWMETRVHHQHIPSLEESLISNIHPSEGSMSQNSPKQL